MPTEDRLPGWKVRAIAASHAVTWFLGQRFPGAFPLVFVVGYPKSGTTWACQLLADCLQLPFPRYSLLPVGCPAVVHGHELVRRSYRRGVYVVRDGRDAMVSRYFFLLRSVPEGDHPEIPRNLRRFFPRLRNKADVKANLVPYIEEEMRRPRFGHHWGEHVRSYFDARNEGVALLKYEDLHHDGVAALARAAAVVTGSEPDLWRAGTALEKFSFARQASRKPGDESRAKFLRKGTTGDWRNHFSPEAAQLFDHHAGDMLVAAGYEPDRSWVGRVGSGGAPPAEAKADEARAGVPRAAAAPPGAPA